MGDGSSKNIEEITEGDIVSSLNEKTYEFEKSIVLGMESPVSNEYYIINNNLLKFTKDYSIYVKKKDGQEGWGAIDPESYKEDIRLGALQKMK